MSVQFGEPMQLLFKNGTKCGSIILSKERKKFFFSVHVNENLSVAPKIEINDFFSINHGTKDYFNLKNNIEYEIENFNVQNKPEMKHKVIDLPD